MRTGSPAPRISIIVATYHAGGTLEQCLRSIDSQTYANRELIIMDGGSTDGTLDLLEAWSKRIAYWESEPDRGIYHAWNKALKHASGEWICFLGADDYFWSETALESLVPALAAPERNSRLIYGRVAVVNDQGQVLYRVGEAWESAGRRFHHVMSMPHLGVMHHRSLFDEFGPFDESYRIAGDYEFLLRELRHAPAQFVAGPEAIVGMRVGGISSQPALALQQLREVRRAQRSLGFRMPGIHWLLAMGRIYLRMALWPVLGEARTRRLLDFGRRLRGLPPFWTRTS